ncbi:hypothetical protein KFE25_003079 [Diacronema lutheri]|uniref:Uncharacterized protein n=1 Tax=Diacronema lutheri TaxID=2081491 RepID=A0A8J6C2K6_DIALT|nr:hypothetical protein KFE25_003079 [Diacronema lutheri]
MAQGAGGSEMGRLIASEVARLQPNEWGLLLVCLAPLVSLLFSPLAFRRLEEEDGAADTRTPGDAVVPGARRDEHDASELRHFAEQLSRLQRSHDQAMRAVQLDVRSLGKEIGQLGNEVAELRASKPRARAPADAPRPRSPAAVEAQYEGRAPKVARAAPVGTFLRAGIGSSGRSGATPNRSSSYPALNRSASPHSS